MIDMPRIRIGLLHRLQVACNNFQTDNLIVNPANGVFAAIPYQIGPMSMNCRLPPARCDVGYRPDRCADHDHLAVPSGTPARSVKDRADERAARPGA